MILAFSSSYFLARYLQFEPEPLIRIALFFLLIMLLKKRVDTGRGLKKHEAACLTAFSFLLTLSLVLGYHIVIEGSTYTGLLTENYISPYSVIDMVAFALMLPGVYLIFSTLFMFMKTAAASKKCTPPRGRKNIENMSIKNVLLFAAILFVAWIPYLLVYWPGFIFGDSLSSLNQAMGNSAWSNHHPFLYTLFIKACLQVGYALGFGSTGGCALYSLIQMAFMAICFGYLFSWILARTHIRKAWGYALAVLFGGTPYVATYSIAMWKDPIFSASLVVLSLLLMDFALSKGTVAKTSRWWIPAYAAFLTIAVFTRGNGLYIAVFLLTSLLVFLTASRKEPASFKGSALASTITALVILVAIAVTGPVYNKIGVAPGSKAESYGVFLNQMARVAAFGGDMSESDRAYMNEMLPLESYPSTYSPCCIDSLKWDAQFNNDVLEQDFFSHWFSMLLKNPGTYFQAWELQTFGFWTVNQPAVNHFASNIASGMPRNTNPQYESGATSIGIYPANKLSIDGLRTYFSQDEWSVPIGMIHWGLMYLALCLVLLNKKRWLLSLVPSFGLFATLLIASPIWYWPRYGATEQFLIPFYLALIVLAVQQEGGGTLNPSEQKLKG